MTTTDNPWLHIPLEDYRGHMGHLGVGQLAMLSDAFAEALRAAQPTSVLTLGCNDGNGLDRIDPHVTRFVTAVDINEDYLARARASHAGRGCALTTVCADAMQLSYPERGCDLIYAGLIFEYLAWESLLPNLADALTIDGRMSVVIQLPSTSEPAVSATPSNSLLRLEPIFSFVRPAQLRTLANAVGMEIVHARIRTTGSFKQCACIDVRRTARRRVRMAQEMR